jgi:hypothetical protein
MTRTIHDSFAKECMQSLLADFGDVEVETAIPNSKILPPQISD